MQYDKLPGGQDSEGTESGETLSKAFSEFEAIQSALQGDAEPVAATETEIRLPISDVLSLLPENVVRSVAADMPSEGDVAIRIDDLFKQLARGKVAVSVAQLVFDFPPQNLPDEALKNTRTLIVLPLDKVVASVDPGQLQAHSAQKYRSYNMEGLPDPFGPELETPDAPAPPAPPSAKQVAQDRAYVSGAARAPKTEAVEPEFGLAPVTEEVALAETQAAPDPARQPVWAPPSTPESEWEQFESLSGVNLNTAGAKTLMTLNGVSEALADIIVAYREEHGPFKQIFDLAAIPRIGRKTFKKVSGMPFSAKGHHRRRKLARLLEMPWSRVAHLASVADAVAARRGFLSCIISDSDGMLLAVSGPAGYAEEFSAVVPGMIATLREGSRVLKEGDLDSAALCIGNRLFTVISMGNVCLTAVLETNKLTKAQFAFIRGVARELAWLLSHRAYVGAVATPGPDAGRAPVS